MSLQYLALSFLALAALSFVTLLYHGRFFYQSEIAELFGITEVTLRHYLRRFEKVLERYELDLESLKRKGLIGKRKRKKQYEFRDRLGLGYRGGTAS